MSLQPIDFRSLSSEESSPFGGALAKSIAQRLEQAKMESEEKKVPYAGLGALADILSKSAYAGVVNPQMQLKAAGNPAIWSQLSDEQKRGAARLASSPGMTNSSNPYADLMQKALQIEKDERNKKTVGQRILDLMNGKENEKAVEPENQPPAQLSIKSQELPSNQEYVQPKTFQQARKATQDQELQANKEYTQPEIQENQSYQTELTPDQKQEKYLADIERAKEAGKLNAKTEKELGDSLSGHRDYQNAIDSFINTVSTPEFRELRQIALAGKYEFGVKEKVGTPHQQYLLGEFASKQGQLVQNYVSQFRGQAMKSEIALANSAKPTRGDTIDVMLGKAASMAELNKMALQREELIAENMANGHTYLQSQLIADKKVNGESIRQQIQERINPSLKPEHFTTQNLQDAAEKMGVSVPEVIKMLEDKGIKIPEGTMNG